MPHIRYIYVQTYINYQDDNDDDNANDDIDNIAYQLVYVDK